MKKIACLFLFFVLSIFTLASVNVNANDDYFDESLLNSSKLLEVKVNEDNREMRAVWVSALVSDIPRYQSTTQYQTAIIKVLDNIKKYNFNTVMFHIRIYNDAFYESKYCKYSSLYRINATWDPLPWIIEQCHLRGIEFHAWMNPYRVSTSTSSTVTEISRKYGALNAASDPKNLLIGNEFVILNPGLPDVQKFLVNVCMEVVEKYDVDGIHFDDYFYAAGVDDSLTYQMYGSSYKNKDDFRRASVSAFIEELHEKITDFNVNNNKAIKLGISPTAIYRCGDGIVTYDENGHAITNGANISTYFDQHYNSACADTLLWIQNDWIDYIVPQLYVDNEQFLTMSTWWDKVVKYEKAQFIAGITENSCEWEHFEKLDNRGGICLFSYKALTKLMNDNLASSYLSKEKYPHLYTGKVSDSFNQEVSFDANIIKRTDGYKLQITKSSDIVNWYIVTNNKNDDVVYLADNTLGKLYEKFEDGLEFTITPYLSNGMLGESKTIKTNEFIYEVNFYDHNNNLIKTDYLNLGDSIVYPDLYSQEGKSYSWDSSVTVLTESLDIHMVESESNFIIKYVDPDGNILYTQTYKYGESLTLPEIPTSLKYIYKRWKVSNIYKVEGNDTIELSYELIDYTLKVYGNDLLLLEKTVNYGDVLSSMLDIITKYNEKEGYEFAGFDNESDIILGDTVVNCLYNEKSYVVTIKDDDEILEEITVKHGESVDLSDLGYSKEGYVFEGLLLNGKTVDKIDSVKSDIVLEADFVIKTTDNGCKSASILYLSFLLLAVAFIMRKR